LEEKCQCGWELPKEIDLSAENRERVQKLGRMVITVICPVCKSPHYSMDYGREEQERKAMYQMYT
jgi:hypothetical protein